MKQETEKEKKAFLLLFGHEVPKKAAYAVVGALCVAVIIGGGLAVSGTLSGQGDGKENMPAVSQVVKKGDKTLTKEAGEKVAKKYEDNLKQNANVDAAEVAKETEAAKETARKDKTEAKTPETSGTAKESGAASSTNSSNAGNSQTAASTASGTNSSKNSSSTKNESSAHQHNWVAQTSTVHHDAVTHQVWHDAVTEEHYICNQCDADITSDPWGHFEKSLMNGGNCGAYHNSYVTVKQGYNETVTDQAAWDETVITGYKCSGCGATK